MIDFHAHILPGADHGSDGLETSLRQLELAEQAGVDTIVATPHFYPQTDSFLSFLRLRERCSAQLINNYRGPIRILLGAEVHMCVGLDHLRDVEELCVSGTAVMLSELSLRGYQSGITETFERMQDDGFTPILAHVDRYDHKLIDNLFSLGLKGQLNAEALTHHWGRRRYLNWIDGGFISALGSDIHGVEIGYSQYTDARAVLGDRADRLDRRAAELLKTAVSLEPAE